MCSSEEKIGGEILESAQDVPDVELGEDNLVTLSYSNLASLEQCNFVGIYRSKTLVTKIIGDISNQVNGVEYVTLFSPRLIRSAFLS